MICRLFYIAYALLCWTTIARSQEYRACNLAGEAFHTSYHITYDPTNALGLPDSCCHDSIRALIREFDLSLSMFNRQSILARMNRNEKGTLANTYVRRVIEKAQKIAQLTNGSFDITIAPLVNLWGFGMKNRHDVTAEQVDSIKKIVGYQGIFLDNKGRLHKKDPRMQLDASSIAKGYMCDIIGNWFKRQGINNYMVEFGGEIALCGTNPKGHSWNIGINTPQEDSLQCINGIQAVLHLTQCGIATSGNYRNFYYRNGKKYAHTIDPVTGYPVQQDILSSTVVADDCLTADAYATAFMVMGAKKALTFLKYHPEIKACFIIDDPKSSSGYRVEKIGL